MNWNDLAEVISKMSPEDRNKDVVFVTYEKCSFGDPITVRG
jgi:hypothetical protein